MHLPERWGMLQFSTGKVNTTREEVNKEWPLRSIAMTLYYAEHAYADAHNGSYTDRVDLLLPYAEPAYALTGLCSQAPKIITSNNSTEFVATISSLNDDMIASITTDRYLTISFQLS